MKFSDFQYARPDMGELKDKFISLLHQFQNVESFEEQDVVMESINSLRKEFESLQQIAAIRYTLDTTNEKYQEEKDYFDENTPLYKELVSKYYYALINSKFKEKLEQKWGKQLFDIAELTIKTFSPEIIEDLREENRLSSEYVKLIASANIMFEGEERNLSGLLPFQMSTDRSMRKRAYEARYKFMESIESNLDDIYDKLVKIRTRIAKKLGYENFVELGYARMLRTDYDDKRVANFRKQVEEDLIDITVELRKRQANRLGLDKLKYYDDLIVFNTGNPKPQGEPQWIVNNAQKMYEEMSPITKEFFNYMIDNELMDLVTRKGKAGGGYCTYIPKYEAPFIFSNFNGTCDDIDVLTHEAGHALQAYMNKDFGVLEYYNPTMEACEIHSMSMEFLAWPWMNLFFEEDTDKYKFSHLNDSLVFIPYAVTVDEFQHFVYSNPEATPAERKSAWRDIEKKYLPHKDYEGNEYLERGGYWHQQGHIFEDPFYYIDYALARVCSLQFWKLANEDREKAMESYLKLCSIGGSKSFLEMLKEVGLVSPFEDGCLKSVTKHIEECLNSI